jgi:hypothetical protein
MLAAWSLLIDVPFCEPPSHSSDSALNNWDNSPYQTVHARWPASARGSQSLTFQAGSSARGRAEPTHASRHQPPPRAWGPGASLALDDERALAGRKRAYGVSSHAVRSPIRTAWAGCLADHSLTELWIAKDDRPRGAGVVHWWHSIRASTLRVQFRRGKTRRARTVNAVRATLAATDGYAGCAQESGDERRAW